MGLTSPLQPDSPWHLGLSFPPASLHHTFSRPYLSMFLQLSPGGPASSCQCLRKGEGGLRGAPDSPSQLAALLSQLEGGNSSPKDGDTGCGPSITQGAATSGEEAAGAASCALLAVPGAQRCSGCTLWEGDEQSPLTSRLPRGCSLPEVLDQDSLSGPSGPAWPAVRSVTLRHPRSWYQGSQVQNPNRPLGAQTGDNSALVYGAYI